MDELRNNVGHLLAELRGPRSRAEVATALGIDIANLINIEERRRHVGRGVLARWLEVLAVDELARARVLTAWLGMDEAARAPSAPPTSDTTPAPASVPQATREVSGPGPGAGALDDQVDDPLDRVGALDDELAELADERLEEDLDDEGNPIPPESGSLQWVATCRRGACGAPMVPVVEDDVWLRNKCTECGCERDLDRPLPVDAIPAAVMRKRGEAA